MNDKQIIASRAAKEIKDNTVVNLGIGLPTMVADYVSEDIHVTFHSENGFLGMGKAAVGEEVKKDIVNAGGKAVTIEKDASFFDSAASFAMIRGGHIHTTILGGLQIDEHGNLANHIIPDIMVPGMGGAMDLVSGAKRVIVAMTHTTNGKPKILKNCTLPLTARGQVDLIVTEMGVIEVTKQGLVLKEVTTGLSVSEVVAATEAELIISPDLRVN